LLRFFLILCRLQPVFSDFFFVLNDCFLSFFNLVFPLLDLLFARSGLYGISQLFSFLLLVFAAFNQPLFVGLGVAFLWTLLCCCPFYVGICTERRGPECAYCQRCMMTTKNLLARLATIRTPPFFPVLI
jgi:hypothetical protein